MSDVTIKVTHYGPKVAEDFDHSTSIIVDGVRGIPDSQFLGLDNHEQLDALIDALQKARKEADE